MPGIGANATTLPGIFGRKREVCVCECHSGPRIRLSDHRPAALLRPCQGAVITPTSSGTRLLSRRNGHGGLAAPVLIRPSFAQGAAPLPPRGNYLIKNGAVITVDAAGVLPRADVHVNNGRIETVGTDLNVADAETIDATDMIVMPGFIDTHYHMWSALGRNFVGDGFGYFPAKNATSKLYTAEDY